jgi:predicted transcriptional regulator
MEELTPIQGELQMQIMSTLWRLGSGTVEQVRQGLPRRYRGAYTTVQTVLNRLAERELVERQRDGRNFVYRPRLSEAEYLSRTIRFTLAGATSDARQAALADLIGGMDKAELGELQKLARTVARARDKRAS